MARWVGAEALVEAVAGEAAGGGDVVGAGRGRDGEAGQDQREAAQHGRGASARSSAASGGGPGRRWHGDSCASGAAGVTLVTEPTNVTGLRQNPCGTTRRCRRSVGPRDNRGVPVRLRPADPAAVGVRARTGSGPGRRTTPTCGCSPSTCWRCWSRRRPAGRWRCGCRRTPWPSACPGPGTPAAPRPRSWRWTPPPGSRSASATWTGPRRPTTPASWPPASGPTSAHLMPLVTAG